jgi:L-ascorbate metabolism protein UlaG (beta-lactamase superfamily)
MIEPKMSGEALLADIRQTAAAEDKRLYLWWLGQSGFLVQYHGHHLLLDPYLSDSLTRKYADSDRPHVRMTGLPIEPWRLDFIDVITSSHNHTDHLDAATILPLVEVNPSVDLIIPAANGRFAAERLGLPIDRLTLINDGETTAASGFTFHAVPAAHETVERDGEGRCRFLGYVVTCGPWKIYHSGDTVLYDDIVDRVGQWEIDVAIVPINGRDPARGVAGNLTGPEAAELAANLGARVAIPCHYDMFEFNTASPDAFLETARQLGQPCRVLPCGQRWCSDELDQLESTQHHLRDRLACLEVFATRMEAEHAVTLLESAGIHARVNVDDTFAGFPLTAGGARLLVFDCDLPRARQLLDHPSEDPETDA